jgi:hypothetical protein
MLTSIRVTSTQMDSFDQNRIDDCRAASTAAKEKVVDRPHQETPK